MNNTTATATAGGGMVRLVTWEGGRRQDRVVPAVFAMAQLDAGYDKVQIINIALDTIDFEGPGL